MSGHGVHVHGPNGHEVEHQSQWGGLGQQMAIFTAILAAIGIIAWF
ncbi:MAG: hypothetical protein IPP91_03055 [Betaproteobacteria bacterium]|nr:hypothetical protein [Betaproteobacteria bacterium]